MASEIPVVTSDPTKTIYGKKSYFAFTPAGGGAAVLFFGRAVDLETTLDLYNLKMPGADGTLRKRYTDTKGGDETFKWEAQEAKKVITAFAGNLTQVLQGTAAFWIKDPRDDATKAAIKIPAFACALYLDNGAKKFSGDEETKPMLVIENTSGEGLILGVDTVVVTA